MRIIVDGLIQVQPRRTETISTYGMDVGQAEVHIRNTRGTRGHVGIIHDYVTGIADGRGVNVSDDLSNIFRESQG